ncbi:MAG: glycosyltransferase [Myxococcales bacterium]|nr:glycosyltransferase [Myxococcales bacterium]
MLLGTLCILLVISLLQCALALGARRAVPAISSLSERDAPPPARWPTLSVIVPAKDEAEHLEPALRSKLASDYPSLQIVVVDDRSTDATPSILRRMLDERTTDTGPELRVARVDALPEGWLGKLHALQRGFEASSGEWVLLADADVHIAPGVLRTLVAHAEAQSIDMIAVFPEMRPVSPIIDASIAGLLRVLCLSARLWKANDDDAKLGLGVGAFNLVRRRWIEETKAFELLRMEVADDVSLGVLLAQSGARTRLFAGRKDVSLVFQPTVGALLRSSDKGAGMLGWGLFKPLAIASAPVLVELALPLAGLVRGGLSALVAALALAAITVTHLLLTAHFAGPMAGATLWPLAHLFNAFAISRAGWLAWRRQGVVWRGTFYPRAVVDAGRRLDLGAMRVRTP